MALIMPPWRTTTILPVIPISSLDMTRYFVVADGRYVTALYGPKGSGIGLTAEKDDAGTWVTYERAVEAARLVAKSHGGVVTVHSVVEPDYPRSWCKAG